MLEGYIYMIDFIIKKGNSFELIGVLLDSNDQPVDISAGILVESQVRSQKDVLIDTMLFERLQTSDPSTLGMYKLSASTATWPSGLSSLMYDIKFTDTVLDRPILSQTGYIRVQESVTK
jgi:hypothetical protein